MAERFAAAPVVVAAGDHVGPTGERGTSIGMGGGAVPPALRRRRRRRRRRRGEVDGEEDGLDAEVEGGGVVHPRRPRLASDLFDEDGPAASSSPPSLAERVDRTDAELEREVESLLGGDGRSGGGGARVGVGIGGVVDGSPLRAPLGRDGGGCAPSIGARKRPRRARGRRCDRGREEEDDEFDFSEDAERAEVDDGGGGGGRPRSFEDAPRSLPALLHRREVGFERRSLRKRGRSSWKSLLLREAASASTPPSSSARSSRRAGGDGTRGDDDGGSGDSERLLPIPARPSARDDARRRIARRSDPAHDSRRRSIGAAGGTAARSLRRRWRPYARRSVPFRHLQTPLSDAILALDRLGDYMIGIGPCNIHEGGLDDAGGCAKGGRRPRLAVKFYGASRDNFFPTGFSNAPTSPCRPLSLKRTPSKWRSRPEPGAAAARRGRARTKVEEVEARRFVLGSHGAAAARRRRSGRRGRLSRSGSKRIRLAGGGNSRADPPQPGRIAGRGVPLASDRRGGVPGGAGERDVRRKSPPFSFVVRDGRRTKLLLSSTNERVSSRSQEEDVLGTIVIFEPPGVRDDAASTLKRTKSLRCSNVRVGGWGSFTMRNALWPTAFVPTTGPDGRAVLRRVPSAHVLFNDEDDGFRMTWLAIDEHFDDEEGRFDSSVADRSTRSPCAVRMTRSDIVVETEGNVWEECVSHAESGHHVGNDGAGKCPGLRAVHEAYLRVDALLSDIIAHRQTSLFEKSPYRNQSVSFMPEFFYNLVRASPDDMKVLIVVVFSNREKRIGSSERVPSALGVFVEVNLSDGSYRELEWVQHATCDDAPSLRRWCDALALNWRMKECRVGMFCLDPSRRPERWVGTTHERNVDEDTDDDVDVELWGEWKGADRRGSPKDVAMSSLYPHCDVITNCGVRDAVPVKRIASRNSPVELVYG
ncbi:hypothetical protein ACHAWF_011803 [Thalassiosira exigua]